MRKVFLDHLKPGMVIKKPVLGFVGQVLLNAGVVVTAKQIYYLKQMGINAVYVEDERIGNADVDDLIKIETRGDCRALVSKIMKDLDASGPLSKGLAIKEQEVKNLASRIVNEITSNQDVLIQLSDIRAQDGYLFAHSVNCCVLATLVGVKMNYDQNTLIMLAIGALLHDIGFVEIPQMILRKPGALSDNEYEAVKKHPEYGYDIFKKSKLFSQRIGEIILQHHERNQGQGYPSGYKGKDVASLARILAVVDVYDALTSEKAYRDAYPVHEAIEMMLSWGEELFDLEVLNIFLESVSAYPIGSLVLLNNNESGLVVDNSPGYSSQPVVRLLYKDGFTPHPSPFNLDLKKVDELKITRLVCESELPEHC